MKVLITGGAGYLGSVLVEELLFDNYSVTVLDNFLYRQTSLLHLCHHQNLSIIKGDVRDKDLVKNLMNDADIIIPLSAIVGMPACKQNPKLAVEVNYEAIKFICANKKDKQLLLYPNTNSGYGIGENNIYCTEETKLNPVSLYGKTKVDAEKEVLSVKNSMVYRLATVFGTSSRMRTDLLVNEFVYKAWQDKYIVLYESHYKRNYVHIRDVAKAFIWAIEHWDKVNGEVFNLGLSNANLSKLELCLKIKEFLPEFHIDLAEISKDDDKRNYIVSNEKIESRGYKATISIEEGIVELLKAYQMLNINQYTNL
jgi:nucleoside-diphosphate-sugar epimerase